MPVIRSDELLTTAAFRGETERVRQMLRHGAASSAPGEHKSTALHWAVSMGHVDIAEVGFAIPQYYTPHAVVMNPSLTGLRERISQLLIEHGANVNAAAANGNAPLHIAAAEGDATMATLLLDTGASPTLCNQSGLTALELADDDALDLIHVLRNAQREHEVRSIMQHEARHRITAGPPTPNFAETNSARYIASGSFVSRSNAAGVSAGCGGDEPLPPDGPLRADMPDDPELPVETKHAKDPAQSSRCCHSDTHGVTLQTPATVRQADEEVIHSAFHLLHVS